MAELDTAIVLREREMFECYDVGLLVYRRFWVPCLLSTLPGSLLIMLLLRLIGGTWWLEGPFQFWLLLICCATLAPIVTAATTLIVGQGMFRRSVSVGMVASAILNAFWPLLIHCLLRFVFAIPYFLGLLFVRQYVPEVVLLERLRGAAARRRLGALAQVAEQPAVAWNALNALLMAIGLLFLLFGGLMLAAVFFSGFDFEEHVLPVVSFVPLLVVLWSMIMIYTATVRFVAYLDVRTRSEGWALEKRLRQLGEEAALS